MFNKLLNSQIKDIYPDLNIISEKELALLKLINETYNAFEKKSENLELKLEDVHTECAEKVEAVKRNTEALINSTDDMIWSIGRDRKLIAANNSFISTIKLLTGTILKPGDYLTQLQGFSTERLTKWDTYYKKVFAGESFTVEEYDNSIGIEVWTELSLQPIFDSDKVIGASCFSKNITESKKTLEIINQSEKMMAEAQRLAHFGSWEMNLIETEDNLLNALKWSDEVYRIFGYSPGVFESSIKNFFDSVHPDDRVLVADAIAQALKENSKYDIEHRVVRPNGEIRWVRDSAEILLDKKTLSPTKMIGTVEDITYRVESERALKNAEANLRNLLENTDTAYVLLDKNATILSFNHMAKIMAQIQTGKSIHEGINYIDIMPDYRKEEVRSKLDLVLQHVEKTSYETTYIDDKGNESWLFVSMHPILNDEKNLLGLSVAARNITELKVYEKERSKITKDLTQRNKDLEQFTYIVSHNLRAPLASILGLSSLLERPDISEEVRKECLKGFVTSVKNLDNTILDLNYILQAKKEIGEKKEMVDFDDTVQKIKESINDIIVKEGAIINTNFIAAEKILAVKSYLYSIFYNLISNSIKYRKVDVSPIITIKSSYINNKTVLFFSDNGIGIDLKENGDKVFGLYKRFQTNIEGKGMGLYMVKTQVETLGGKISIVSDLGVGTEFTIEFDS
ncbi:MAG: PAS domain S-box protein [Bacteroidia bacterium]|nr:PAS domain S-box protein [Bacteroidia bacterium]